VRLFFVFLYLITFDFRFQDCIAQLRTFTPSTSIQDRIDVNLNLLHLAQDFIYAATTYGKIIISEYYLPFEKKTIKPCSLPGVRRRYFHPEVGQIAL
jgi:hypothetical protein